MLLLCCNRFAARPDHWRSKQASKESTYKDFYATFGSSDKKPTKMDGFLSTTSDHKSNPKNVMEVSKEIGQSLASAASFLSKPVSTRKSKKGKQKSKKDAPIGGDDGTSKRKKKSSKKKKDGASVKAATAAVISVKKRQRNNDLSEASQKKLKA